MRAGHDLVGLQHVLVTHECAGLVELLRERSAGGVRATVDMVGAAGVLDRVQQQLGPDVQVSCRKVGHGDRLRLGAYDVRVLDPGAPTTAGPTRDTVAFDIAGSTARVLFAPIVGELPTGSVDALRDASVDVVLLGLDAGGPAVFAERLRRLRSAGALSASADVVACGLSHDHRSPAELSRVLGAWGSRVVEDGTELGADLGAGTLRRSTGRTVVIGGARSGKSREAELLLVDQDEVQYVATSYPAATDDSAGADPEWAERVRVHRERRPAHWSTLETVDLVPLLATDGPPLLVDCLTLWLTRMMDRHDAWDDEVWAGTGDKAVQQEMDDLVRAWRTTGRRVVAVTNEVGQGLVPEGSGSRRFRDAMGRLNAALCAVSEDVRWCVAGRVVHL